MRVANSALVDLVGVPPKVQNKLVAGVDMLFGITIAMSLGRSLPKTRAASLGVLAIVGKVASSTYMGFPVCVTNVQESFQDVHSKPASPQLALCALRAFGRWHHERLGVSLPHKARRPDS